MDALKRPFLGQVSLKVSLFGLEGDYPPVPAQKVVTTLSLPRNGVSGDSVNYLHNRKENAEQIPPLPPIQSIERHLLRARLHDRC